MSIFNVLMPVAILGSIGTSLYLIIKVITEYILRKKMIEKGYVNDENQSILKQYQTEGRFSALKWGIIILSGGIALILIHSLNVDPETPLPYGIFAVCLSLGFLVYYFIVRKDIQ
jgi:hypothetical protein